MNTEMDEVSQRCFKLIAHLTKEAKSHDWRARLYSRVDTTCFYGSMFFGGIAVVLGLIKVVHVPSELISVCAAIATGLTFFAKEAKLRARADWFFAVRDSAQQLINRLDFELPIPITRDDIAAVSEEWRMTRAKLGERMSAINNPEKRKS